MHAYKYYKDVKGIKVSFSYSERKKKIKKNIKCPNIICKDYRNTAISLAMKCEIHFFPRSTF